MSVAALPGGMLGARSRLRPLPLSLVGWCASRNNNNNTTNKNYKDLEIEITRMYHLNAATIPVIVGALGMIRKGTSKNIEKIPGNS